MDQSLLRRPVYSKLLALYNNYDVSTEMHSSYFASQADCMVKETVTRSELNEEEDFLDEVMKSDVMKETMRCCQIILTIIFNKKRPRPKLPPDNFNFRFLAAKQLFTKSATEFKKLLKEFWFTLYSRGNRILGSRLEKSFDF